MISGEANIEEVKKMLYNENEEYREKIDKLKEINDFIDN
ncbi:MAG: DegQ family regulator [Patescibacteria group bacterium]|nr:DegQ family regulator [Patescibacteria group bacterium]